MIFTMAIFYGWPLKILCGFADFKLGYRRGTSLQKKSSRPINFPKNKDIINQIHNNQYLNLCEQLL